MHRNYLRRIPDLPALCRKFEKERATLEVSKEEKKQTCSFGF